MRLFTREPFGEIWGEVNRISDEMNKLFGRRSPTALPVNLWADEHNLYAEFDLPDVDPAKLEVTVTEGTKLSIAGDRAAPDEAGAVWVRQERPFGAFSREVTLPVLVDADKVQANYENGVLKLTLPKSEAAKPRKITVTV
jgi:HSP20 family protein